MLVLFRFVVKYNYLLGTIICDVLYELSVTLVAKQANQMTTPKSHFVSRFD